MTDLVHDELDLLASLLPLAGARLVEAGCGAAGLARALLARFPDAELTGLEVDERQLAKNLAEPPLPGLRFLRAGAQQMPLPDAGFDGGLMLKSLHHVPLGRMDDALAEMARVLKPGGWLYVSEPVYAGPFNALIKLFNDEGVVRAAAQLAIDHALALGPWQAGPERRFTMPVHFKDFADFERRMMRPTYADHRIDEALLAAVQRDFAPHCGTDGAHFQRPMHLRVLYRRG